MYRFLLNVTAHVILFFRTANEIVDEAQGCRGRMYPVMNARKHIRSEIDFATRPADKASASTGRFDISAYEYK